MVKEKVMITIIDQNVKNLLQVEIKGKLTKEEVHKVGETCKQLIAEHKTIRTLIIGTEFEGYTLGAFFEDLKFCLGHLNDFEKIAFVGNKKYEEVISNMSSLFMKGEMKYFDESQMKEAKEWVNK